MRMTRAEYMDAHPRRERKPTPRDVAELMAKAVRRELKAKGLWEPRPMRIWGWSFQGHDGVVHAHCRSDARGLIKQALDIKQKDRLPVKVTITELANGLDRDAVHGGGSLAISQPA